MFIALASLQLVTNKAFNGTVMKRINERLVLWTLATYLIFFVCLIPVGYISNRFVNQLEGFYAANLTFVIGLISLISLACFSVSLNSG